MVDALGREWTGPTIQFDFNLPERFESNYIGEDGERHRAGDDPPHAARLDGALRRRADRALRRGVPGLVGSGAGRGHPHHRRPDSDSRDEVVRRLSEAGLRVEINDRRDRMQAKIREAQLQKIPYMLVIGKREVAEDAVAVRLRNGRDLGAMPVAQFLELALPRVESRSLYLDDTEKAEAREGELAAAAAS